MNLTIYKYILKKRWLSLLVWTIVWVGMAALFMSLFETFKEQADVTAEYIQSFPEGMLTAFGIDPELFFSDIKHFIGGEFLTFYIVAAAVFGGIIGTSILGDMIKDKDLIFWLTQPVTRLSLYFKIIISISVLLLISNFIISFSLIPFAHLFTEDAIPVQYVLNVAISSSVFMLMSVYIGNLLALVLKTTRTTGIAITVILGTWMLDIMSKMGGFPEFLQYFSPFYYFDIPYLNSNNTLDWKLFAFIPLLGFLCILIGAITFNRRDYAS